MDGEIKTIEIDGTKFEVHTKYKIAELEIFGKGKKIIESCQTFDQLESAIKFTDLIKDNYIGAGNALGYLIELQKQTIQELLSELDASALAEIENINVIYENVTSDKNEES